MPLTVRRRSVSGTQIEGICSPSHHALPAPDRRHPAHRPSLSEPLQPRDPQRRTATELPYQCRAVRSGSDKERTEVRVVPPPRKIKLKRIHREFKLEDKKPAKGLSPNWNRSTPSSTSCFTTNKKDSAPLMQPNKLRLGRRSVAPTGEAHIQRDHPCGRDFPLSQQAVPDNSGDFG